MSFSLSPDQRASVIEAITDSPNIIRSVSQAAKEILPNYDVVDPFAESAVLAGGGNCFAQSEVVSVVANFVPGCENAVCISYGRAGSNHLVHAENLVTFGYKGAKIDNTLRGPDTLDYNEATKDPGFSAVELTQRARNGAIMYAASPDSFNWDIFLGELKDYNPPQLDYDPAEVRLYMTGETGVQGLRNFIIANRLRKSNRRLYEKFVMKHGSYIPRFRHRELEKVN